MRLELLQQNVGRYFEQYVGNEENCQGRVVLSAFAVQAQIFLQAEYRCIGDVGAIQKCKKVHDAKNGNDAEVDLCNQSPLGRVRWALYMKVMVVFSIWVSDIWIVIVVDRVTPATQ